MLYSPWDTPISNLQLVLSDHQHLSWSGFKSSPAADLAVVQP